MHTSAISIQYTRFINSCHMNISLSILYLILNIHGISVDTHTTYKLKKKIQRKSSELFFLLHYPLYEQPRNNVLDVSGCHS